MARKRWLSGSIVVLLVSALLLSGCFGAVKEKEAEQFFQDVTAAFRSFNAFKIINLIHLPKLDEAEQEFFDEVVASIQEILDHMELTFKELTVKFVNAPGRKIEITYAKDYKEAIVKNAALAISVKVNKNDLYRALKEVWDNLDEEDFPFSDGVPAWDEFWTEFKEELDWDNWDGTFEYPTLELPSFPLVKINNKWKLPFDFLEEGYDTFNSNKIFSMIFKPFAVR
ncbi:MAG: hypothetical protein GX335_08455 [Firmicutes bacterium]|nr:hypothetical protein [Bacillota bacterium]